MTSEEQRIREFAYQIWQSEGCPHGQEERHWEMARKLVQAQNDSPVAKLVSRSRKTATKPTEVGAADAVSASKSRPKRAAAKGETPAAATAADAPQAPKKPRNPRAKKDA